MRGGGALCNSHRVRLGRGLRVKMMDWKHRIKKFSIPDNNQQKHTIAPTKLNIDM